MQRSTGRRRPAQPLLGRAVLRAAARRVLKAGRILVEGGEPIACSVTTLGPAGAGLGVNDGTAVPDAFRLAIAADGFERACRVTVRAARHVEVEFG